jgi:cold shock CspA family protein
VEVHYFRGRLPAYEAHNRNKLLSERIFDDILMREGVVTHYLPVTNRGEKGIDVWLALEAFEQTIFKGFNVLVLITCDGDYVPLIRKINGIGTRVMVLAWDFEFTDEYGVNRTTVTSTDLLAEVSYPVHMDQIIDDPERQHDSVISNIFVQRDPENHYNAGGHGNTGNTYYSMSVQPMNEPIHANHRIDPNNNSNSYRTNRVHSIKEGYGFVQTEIPGKNLFFFWEDVLGDFNDLRPGDLVEYKLGMNQKGECAKEIRKIRSGNTDPNFNYSPYPMHSDSE